ncbi:unnamed protein product [Phytophthora fragariaefolia]|uniref:Unnamed protein product n=1 Tax=Phytophthora fragariaefolia TaxID=1490495 RepID=A0A9W6XSH8_9STRA|nr:unnamed protein product [Phytophthora fragariaefolia]
MEEARGQTGSDRDTDSGADGYDAGGCGGCATAGSAAGDDNGNSDAHDVETEVALAEDVVVGECVEYLDAVSFKTTKLALMGN